MFGAYNAGTLGRAGSWSLADLELLLRPTGVFAALVDAAAVVALAVAELTDRRPAPRPED
jgi:hypothetical protein